MRTRVFAAACVVLCCTLLQGCIILPVPVPRSSGPAAGSRAEMSKTLPEQIKVGETTRKDVLLLLGEPDGRGDQDRWFTYGSRVGRGGIGWSLVIGVYGGRTDAFRFGDWERVRRATIRFDSAGVVSQVDVEEARCTNDAPDFIHHHGCPVTSGMIITAEEGKRMAADSADRLAEERDTVVAERTAQLAAAGPILAKYTDFKGIEQTDCSGFHVNQYGARDMYGDELLIAEHAMLMSDKSGLVGTGPGGPLYAVLGYNEIAEVRPIEEHFLRHWIPIRTRSGSCLYLRPMPQTGELSMEAARALILAHLTPGAAPAPSESQP